MQTPEINSNRIIIQQPQRQNTNTNAEFLRKFTKEVSVVYPISTICLFASAGALFSLSPATVAGASVLAGMGGCTLICSAVNVVKTCNRLMEESLNDEESVGFDNLTPPTYEEAQGSEKTSEPTPYNKFIDDSKSTKAQKVKLGHQLKEAGFRKEQIESFLNGKINFLAKTDLADGVYYLPQHLQNSVDVNNVNENIQNINALEVNQNTNNLTTRNNTQTSTRQYNSTEYVGIY